MGRIARQEHSKGIAKNRIELISKGYASHRLDKQ